MQDTYFPAADLRFTTISECTAAELALLSLHVVTQYPRDGKKHPDRSLEWLFLHGLPSKRPQGYNYQVPHQIYIAFDTSGRIVDVAGVVPDDRGVAKQLGLFEIDSYYFGFLGGHRVHPDLRGRGIGTLMIQHRIERIQDFVNKTLHAPAAVYAFLTNEISAKLLSKAQFENLGLKYIEDSQGEEYVYRRLIRA
jgi:GNAT superfamily N-acetyltransferase